MCAVTWNYGRPKPFINPQISLSLLHIDVCCYLELWPSWTFYQPTNIPQSASNKCVLLLGIMARPEAFINPQICLSLLHIDVWSYLELWPSWTFHHLTKIPQFLPLLRVTYADFPIDEIYALLEYCAAYDSTYRRSGTTCRSHLKGSSSSWKVWPVKMRPDRLSWNVGT